MRSPKALIALRGDELLLISAGVGGAEHLTVAFGGNHLPLVH